MASFWHDVWLKTINGNKNNRLKFFLLFLVFDLVIISINFMLVNCELSVLNMS